MQNGKLGTVRVKQEVVVSAGATRSPQILMLSGIGRKEYLKHMNIPVVKDLPGVGENLHDHVTFQLDFVINDPDTYDNNWAVAFEYLAYQTGPLSYPGLNPVMAGLSTNASTPDFPNIQMYFTGYSAACSPGEINTLRSQGRRPVSMRVVNMHPKSRGKITEYRISIYWVASEIEVRMFQKLRYSCFRKGQLGLERSFRASSVLDELSERSARRRSSGKRHRVSSSIGRDKGHASLELDFDYRTH